jgi:hypothetical protein
LKDIIRKSKENGAPLKELCQVLPGLSSRQIQILLKELRDEGLIQPQGKVGAAVWHTVKSE